MPARYHLRFQIHPTSAAERQAVELAEFCRQSGIDEVVLLLGAEELYNGHPSGDEEDRLYDAAATAATVLRDAGLDVSLNPWVTAGHADRGRYDRLGFAPMAGPDGQPAVGQASFACPRWRTWIAAHYGRFAELGFRVLWLEDDFRYHNHAPLEWGGGFEPLMLDRLAELVGRTVRREEVVAAVTAPGAPHPWRALLQQTWRTSQLEVATLVAEAVEKHSEGRSRLGLMSSGPGAHAVEGRDWTALFDALTIEGEVVHRPHFAPYSDVPGRELSRSIWMLDVQRSLRPSSVHSEPEIENWPHTAWSKADTQTWSEMVTAQLSGADALFLNVLPVQSGHARRFPEVTSLLQRSRPALDLVAERRDNELGTLGVGLAFNSEASAHVRTQRTGKLADLAVDPGAAADFLLRYGVPVTAEDAPVRVLFGQVARSFDDDALRRMLSGGLLLDGIAAQVLTERGFGELLGVTVSEIVGRQEPAAPGPYSLEHAHTLPTDEDSDVFLSVNMQPSLARLHPADGAEVWTNILTPDLQAWGPGRCVFTNPLGGRVAVLAATAPELLPYDDDGQRLLHATVRYLEAGAPVLPLVSGGPYLVPRLARTGRGWQLAITNGSADPARPRIALPFPPDAAEATLLAPLHVPTSTTMTATTGFLTLDQDLPHRGWLLVDGVDGLTIRRR
ncbi:hypothetical protein [Streptomyces beijiangensis]|uniref:Uncharacterized protein n=1 Tax=Streptomyces beijiangensis TaxID=163361 RepID=A0A939JGV9_9ACTN|nr:hypothetical protein [Streptomyces beijiangensis]MBO0515596.1 hypothetical protein [Streptomyces beijiangensis]